jgi:hypothetical protein
VIVIAVDLHDEEVGVRKPGVAPGQPCRDRLRVAEHRAYVERLVVVEQADVRALGGRLALVRIDLREARDRLRRRPRGLVRVTVDLDAPRRAARHRGRRRFVRHERRPRLRRRARSRRLRRERADEPRREDRQRKGGRCAAAHESSFVRWCGWAGARSRRHGGDAGSPGRPPARRAGRGSDPGCQAGVGGAGSAGVPNTISVIALRLRRP